MSKLGKKAGKKKNICEAFEENSKKRLQATVKVWYIWPSKLLSAR